MVQLGSRITPAQNSVALVWQTTDADHEYSEVLRQGKRKLKASVDHGIVATEGA